MKIRENHLNFFNVLQTFPLQSTILYHQIHALTLVHLQECLILHYLDVPNSNSKLQMSYFHHVIKKLNN